MIKSTSSRINQEIKGFTKTKNNCNIIKNNLKVELKLKDSNLLVNRVNTPISKTPHTPHGNKKIEISHSNKIEKSKKNFFFKKIIHSETDYSNKVCSTAPSEGDTKKLCKNHTNKKLERHISYGNIEVNINYF